MPDLPHVFDVVRPAVVARRPKVPNVENRADLDALLVPGALAAVAAFVEDQDLDVDSIHPLVRAVHPEVNLGKGHVVPTFDPRPGIRQLHRIAGWSATRHAPRSTDEWMPQVLAAGDAIAVLEWLAGPPARLNPVHVWIHRRRRTQVAADRAAVERTHQRRNEIARLRQLEDALLPLAIPVVREVLDDLRRAVQEYPISRTTEGIPNG